MPGEHAAQLGGARAAECRAGGALAARGCDHRPRPAAQRGRERPGQHALLVDGHRHRDQRVGANARVVLVEAGVLDGHFLAGGETRAQSPVEGGDGAAGDDQIRALDSVRFESRPHEAHEAWVEVAAAVGVALRADPGEDWPQVGQQARIGIGHLKVDRTRRGRRLDVLAMGGALHDAGASPAVGGHHALCAQRLVGGGGGPGADAQHAGHVAHRGQQRFRRDAALADQALDLTGQLDGGARLD